MEREITAVVQDIIPMAQYSIRSLAAGIQRRVSFRADAVLQAVVLVDWCRHASPWS